MLRVSRAALILLDAGTWLAILFFAAMLGMMLLGLPYALHHAEHAALPGHAAEMRRWFEAMMLVGIATGLAVDHIFRRLLRLLETVRTGRPFTAANGVRLRAIAWALLAIQLLDLAFAGIVHGIDRIAVRVAFTWSPAATGWIAVLLLFVLAQVFAQGAGMQDDLEGTV